MKQEIIFCKDFNMEEILEKFKSFCKDEHDKRIIKKGKLFSIYASEDSIDFGKVNLLGVEAELIYKNCFNGSLLYQKYKDTVAKCLKILAESCAENGTVIQKKPTGGTATEYVIFRLS